MIKKYDVFTFGRDTDGLCSWNKFSTAFMGTVHHKIATNHPNPVFRQLCIFKT